MRVSEPALSEQPAVIAAVRSGPDAKFADLLERHRRELHVHCYRMLGSLSESEDMVQETSLRAWRRRATFEGRSSFRAWLYRIATNICLDTLRSRPRRMLPYDAAPATDLRGGLPTPTIVASIEPYPSSRFDPAIIGEDDPVTMVVAKETIELAFLAAIQHLTPSQRAVLILRDVIGWSAGETAELLESTVPAVKSSLQRARTTMRYRLPGTRLDWAATREPSAADRSLLERYMKAHEHGDTTTLTSLLREDVRVAYPPTTLWCEGRDNFVEGSREHAAAGEYRFLATTANMQPACAIYLRPPGSGEFRPLVLEVLRCLDGQIAEILDFDARLFPMFGLPPTV